MQSDSVALTEYLLLEQRLLEWRRTHPEDSPQEDDLLDQMDAVWWRLTKEERVLLKARRR